MGMTPEEAREKSPQERFIRAELELGLTLVQLARAERNNRNEEATAEAISRAIVIRANIQHFISILKTDPEVKSELEEMLNYLRFVIDSFSN